MSPRDPDPAPRWWVLLLIGLLAVSPWLAIGACTMYLIRP